MAMYTLPALFGIACFVVLLVDATDDALTQAELSPDDDLWTQQTDLDCVMKIDLLQVQLSVGEDNQENSTSRGNTSHAHVNVPGKVASPTEAAVESSQSVLMRSLYDAMDSANAFFAEKKHSHKSNNFAVITVILLIMIPALLATVYVLCDRSKVEQSKVLSEIEKYTTPTRYQTDIYDKSHMDVPETKGAVSMPAVPTFMPAPIYDLFVLPNHDSRFVIPHDNLAEWHKQAPGAALAVLGSIGYPLLHIWRESTESGIYLKIAPEMKTKVPLAAIGPLILPSKSSSNVLQVVGPKDQPYGTLSLRSNGFDVEKEGKTVLRAAHGSGAALLKIQLESGRTMAEVTLGSDIKLAARGKDRKVIDNGLLILCSPGCDSVLTTLASLAYLLLTPQMLSRIL